MAEIYHQKIKVYHYHSNQVGIKSFGSGDTSILLAYSDGNHYDSVMTKDFRNNSAICQCKIYFIILLKIRISFIAILYELLFKSVFKLPVPKRQDLPVHTRQHRDSSADLSLKDLMAFSSKVYFNAALGVHKTYREGKFTQRTLVHNYCNSKLKMGKVC